MLEHTIELLGLFSRGHAKNKELWSALVEALTGALEADENGALPRSLRCPHSCYGGATENKTRLIQKGGRRSVNTGFWTTARVSKITPAVVAQLKSPVVLVGTNKKKRLEARSASASSASDSDSDSDDDEDDTSMSDGSLPSTHDAATAAKSKSNDDDADDEPSEEKQLGSLVRQLAIVAESTGESALRALNAALFRASRSSSPDADEDDEGDEEEGEDGAAAAGAGAGAMSADELQLRSRRLALELLTIIWRTLGGDDNDNDAATQEKMLALVPESTPFLAEALDDVALVNKKRGRRGGGEGGVRRAAKDLARAIERVLGESLDSYM